MPPFLVACALLVVAGAAKLAAPAPARDAIALVAGRPPALAVRALGAAEAAAGVVAAISPGAAQCSLVALAYGAFCAFAVILVRLDERPVDCGCFGTASAGAGRSHAVLCAAGCAIAAAAAVTPPPGVAWVFGRAPFVAIVLTIGMAAATFAAHLAFTVFPKVWRAYGSEVPP